MKFTAILYTGLEYEEGNVTIQEVDAKNPVEAEEKAIAKAKEEKSWLPDLIVRPRAIYKGHLKNLRVK